MNENTYINDVLLPSLDSAAEVFRKDGIRAELSIGPSGAPGILLIYPEENLTISCDPLDSDGEQQLFYYEVSCFGDRPFGFPSVYLPEKMDVFPFLPRMYRWLRFGMGEDAPSDHGVAAIYARTRLQGLMGELMELGYDPELINAVQDGSEEVLPGLRIPEGDEELIFTYRYVIPEQQICMLSVTCGEEAAFLPGI